MKTQIIIKTDKEVKKDAQKIAQNLGLPLSTVINAYLKDFIRNREIKLSLEPKLRPEVEKFLKKASEDFRKGRNISPVFTSTKKMLDYLHSQ
ncbi:MAG: type II toxin-antitoxin system RelB/DinJ family antitoxin [Candidatus Doudnabacteria bacterium]|nr:type II toxin-antitoxin system RelB/DinJ family antitoxin [Candidatus Doudnabacteria bacterium]